MAEQLVSAVRPGGGQKGGFQNEQGDDVVVVGGGRSPSRVVLEAEIASEPDDARVVSCGPVPR